MVAEWNRQARSGAVTETIHGVRVVDPYRALELDTPATRQWVQLQTDRSERYLSTHARTGMEERLARLLSIGVLSGPTAAGGHLFFEKRDGEREQPLLMVADAAGRDRPGTWTAARPLVDPTTFGERSALDWYYPSPRGRYVAFGISHNGDERSTLYVADTATGARLPVEIANAKWAQLSWLPDEAGFYYTRYPRQGEDGYNADEPDTYWPRVFFHRMPVARQPTTPEVAAGNADPVVFSGIERTDFPEPVVSSDGRWLVIDNFRGWSKQEVSIADRHARVASGQRPDFVGVIRNRDSLSSGFVHEGRLVVTTNDGHPRYHIVSVSVAAFLRADHERATHAPGPAPADPFAAPLWREVVPEGPNPIEQSKIVGGRIVAHYIENVVSKVRVFSLDGESLGEVTLPGDGSIDGLAGRPDQPELAFGYSSFFYPPTIFAADLRQAAAGGALAPVQIDQVQTDFDASAYELSRASVRSRDGTEVNVWYMHRRGMVRDGNAYVLLTGYGGFNVSLTPTFGRSPLYWLERGGVYAVANLRGGSEHGEQWHRAGALGNKVHVFEDMEAVIRWFSSSGLSRPERVAIHGASNGGLLMGAMITRCPDAFRATATYVGLYDMVRFHRFPPAELWVTEYGSSDDAEQFRWLLSYSPYHNIHDGTRYPAVWVETADHDTRVYWGHSTKFAARLQEAQAGQLPIFFYREANVGHGAGTQRSDLIRRYVRMYTFLEDQLQLPASER